MCHAFMFFFFFSSRRRHTRLQGDWSSDVCSSDLIEELEQRSGVARGDVAAFATHQPNPRLVALLAKKIRVPAGRFPLVADLRGNLGSTTCASALHYALERASSESLSARKPIFLASLGPGLLFGGG